MFAELESLGSLEKMLVFFIVAHIGYFLHAIKLYAKSETQYNPVDYFIKANPKQSLLSYVTFLGSAIAILFTLNDDGFRAMLLAVFSTSYAVDSMVNDDRGSHVTDLTPDQPDAGPHA